MDIEKKREWLCARLVHFLFCSECLLIFIFISGIEETNGAPFSTKLTTSKDIYSIEQISGFTEEVHISLSCVDKIIKHVFYEIGTINFEKINSEGNIIGIVQQISSDFKELSILRIGPAPNQRR